MMLKKHIQYAAFTLTHACNLSCEYCYTGEKKNVTMSESTALSAIDFLAQNSDGKIAVSFFGGEPILEIDLLKKVVSYTKEKYGKRFLFRLSTNGTLLNQETLDFFKKHDVIFSLSIDGNEMSHNQNRIYKSGKGSYQIVAEKIPQILKFNPYTIAIYVVVPNTCQYLYDGVVSLYDKGFRYVLQTLDFSANWTKENIKTLEGEFKKLSVYYYNALEAEKKIYLNSFDERIKTHTKGKYCKGCVCDIANSEIAIAPSGNIYPCVQFIKDDKQETSDFLIGNIFQGFEDDKRKEIVRTNLSKVESCKGCALEGRCSTYCACANWSSTGQINKIPPVLCEYERMLMPIADKLASKLWKNKVKLFEKKFYDPTFPISSYIEDCKINTYE
jgi:uncharacterized protein